MKLYSALYKDFYPFKEMGLFDATACVSYPNEMDTKDSALVVWGGSDISPALYNKGVATRTDATNKPSKRDMFEWWLMVDAREKGIPIIGVCRGAQMLCALAGGFLIQDVTHHAGHNHKVVTKDGRSFMVNSLHHQMLYPFDVEHEMVAWSEQPLSRHYTDVDSEGQDVQIDVPLEPEFVYFPKEKGIAIQWHPEYMEFGKEAQGYVKEQLQRLM
jgi:putative glutamine amidotransferase